MDLEQVFQITPAFSITLIKLEEHFSQLLPSILMTKT